VTASAPRAGWRRLSERGNTPLLKFMAWFSLRVGRAPARVLLRLIAAYYFAFGTAERRATRDFLTRCLGRAPTLAETYRVFFNFAATVHDRIFFLKGRFELFDVSLEGTGIFDASGALLMGAHLGSYEAMRAAGHGHAHRAVAMAMYEENARRINAVLYAIDPSLQGDVVALGHIGSMLALRDRLEAGAFVGVLADRTLGDEAMIDIEFLGSPAPFPTGPMRMAAALRRKVFFMAGLYRGANRYEIHFEPLADFTAIDDLGRADRQRLVHEAVRRYAARLEHYCRAAPDNWFNFHPFWRA
jgi:predicted LPLAT superfamily acyltransferase